MSNKSYIKKQSKIHSADHKIAAKQTIIYIKKKKKKIPENYLYIKEIKKVYVIA